jgi:prepilin peptidase CpaA
MNLYQSFAIGVVLIAVVTDLKSRRIPNLLTLGAALTAVVVHGYVAGWSGIGMALAGWLVGAAFFFPIFALGGMGAGDVKLMAAVGAWLGPGAIVWVALYSSIAGGVMALVVAGFAGYLGQAFTNLWCLLMYWRIEGPRPVPELTLSSHRGPRLAYALPVFAGLMVTLWLR